MTSRVIFLCVGALVFATPLWPAGVAGVAGVARAQHTLGAPKPKAIILVPGGDKELPAGVKAEALASISSVVKAQGYTVVRLDEISKSLPPAIRNCDKRTCAAEVIATTKSDRAVHLTLWGDAPRLRVHTVVVTLFDQAGNGFGSSIDLENKPTNLEPACRAGYFEADALFRTGKPTTAVTHPIGRPAAATQMASTAGTAATTTDATAATATTAPTNPDPLKLKEPTSTATTHATQASPWNYVIGGALAASGVFFAASTIRTAAQSGDCLDRNSDGFCVEKVSFNPMGWVYLGTALASAAGATYFLIAQPIHVQVTTTGNGAMFQLKRNF
jgi:hypothetical protein